MDHVELYSYYLFVCVIIILKANQYRCESIFNTTELNILTVCVTNKIIIIYNMISDIITAFVLQYYQTIIKSVGRHDLQSV